MKNFIINLLFRNRYKELEEFQELAKHAGTYHVNGDTICDFLTECNVEQENFVKMWNLCNNNFSFFLLCMCKYKAGESKKEDILNNIVNSNKDFFIKG